MLLEYDDTTMTRYTTRATFWSDNMRPLQASSILILFHLSLGLRFTLCFHCTTCLLQTVFVRACRCFFDDSLHLQYSATIATPTICFHSHAPWYVLLCCFICHIVNDYNVSSRSNNGHNLVKTTAAELILLICDVIVWVRSLCFFWRGSAGSIQFLWEAMSKQ